MTPTKHTTHRFGGGLAALTLVFFTLSGFAASAVAQDPSQAAVKAIALELGFDSSKVSYIDENKNGNYDDGELILLDVDCSEEFVKAVKGAVKNNPKLVIEIAEAVVLLMEEIDTDCLATLAAAIAEESGIDSQTIIGAMAAMMPDDSLVPTFTESALALMPSTTVPGTDGNTNIEIEPGDGPSPTPTPPDSGPVTPVS